MSDLKRSDPGQHQSYQQGVRRYLWRHLYNGWWAGHAALVLILLGIARAFWVPPENFPGSTTYAGFALIATEQTWSIMLGFAALLGALGLFIERRWVVGCSTVVLCLAHSTVAGLVLWARPESAIVGGTFTVLAVWSLGRLIRGHHDER